MEFTVRLRGRGRVEVAAYGVGDAEHLVEREIQRLWPEATVQVVELARSGEPRIVEEFTAGYLVQGSVRVEADRREAAPGAAFRHVRGRFAGSRYARIEWEAIEVRSAE